jgi:chromosome segregation ATPase
MSDGFDQYHSKISSSEALILEEMRREILGFKKTVQHDIEETNSKIGTFDSEASQSHSKLISRLRDHEQKIETSFELSQKEVDTLKKKISCLETSLFTNAPPLLSKDLSKGHVDDLSDKSKKTESGTAQVVMDLKLKLEEQEKRLDQLASSHENLSKSSPWIPEIDALKSNMMNISSSWSSHLSDLQSTAAKIQALEHFVQEQVTRSNTESRLISLQDEIKVQAAEVQSVLKKTSELYSLFQNSEKQVKHITDLQLELKVKQLVEQNRQTLSDSRILEDKVDTLKETLKEIPAIKKQVNVLEKKTIEMLQDAVKKPQLESILINQETVLSEKLERALSENSMLKYLSDTATSFPEIQQKVSSLEFFLSEKTKTIEKNTWIIQDIQKALNSLDHERKDLQNAISEANLLSNLNDKSSVLTEVHDRLETLESEIKIQKEELRQRKGAVDSLQAAMTQAKSEGAPRSNFTDEEAQKELSDRLTMLEKQLETHASLIDQKEHVIERLQSLLDLQETQQSIFLYESYIRS